MKIIDMCHSAAAPAIKLQCGYGFSDRGKNKSYRSFLFNCSRVEWSSNIKHQWAGFVKQQATVAKSQNRRFKMKNVYKNMLYKNKTDGKLDKVS